MLIGKKFFGSIAKMAKIVFYCIAIFLCFIIFYISFIAILWFSSSFIYHSGLKVESFELFSWMEALNLPDYNNLNAVEDVGKGNAGEQQSVGEKDDSNKEDALYGEDCDEKVEYIREELENMKEIANNVNEETSHEGIVKPDSKLICVLQNVDFSDLEEVDFDIAIVDPDDSGLTSSNLRYFIEKDKIVLAYLSIGEAENYRSYWGKDWEVGNPEFVDEHNPEWEGNFKVKFWYDSWQDIVFSQLQKIIDLGYSGVYLDVVDIYKFYEQKGYDFARDEMVKLVVKISEYTKEQNEDFLIVPQNAEELVADSGYLLAIDGIGKENLWFIGDDLQSKEEIYKSLYYLSEVKMSNKFVFVIGYVSAKPNIEEFLKLAKSYGFIPYIGRKELDTIETHIFD